MRGKNTIPVPSELYSPVVGGYVVSADGVKDYKQGLSQEELNETLIATAEEAKTVAQKAANSASSMENIIKTLEEHSEDDLAKVLDIENRTEELESSTAAINSALGGLKLQHISEDDYETLVAEGRIDNSTVYLISEKEGELE